MEKEIIDKEPTNDNDEIPIVKKTKQKRAYVMTDARKLAIEKMKSARALKVSEIKKNKEEDALILSKAKSTKTKEPVIETDIKPVIKPVEIVEPVTVPTKPIKRQTNKKKSNQVIIFADSSDSSDDDSNQIIIKRKRKKEKEKEKEKEILQTTSLPYPRLRRLP